MVLAALRQANVAVVPAEAAVAPRRATTQEEEAIKAAAQSGRLKLVRLEPAADLNALAVLTPTRASVSLPERRSERPLCAAPSAPRARYERTVCGSRAPPHG